MKKKRKKRKLHSNFQVLINYYLISLVLFANVINKNARIKYRHTYIMINSYTLYKMEINMIIIVQYQMLDFPYLLWKKKKKTP